MHASYQLSVSVLTYMSSHKLSQKATVRQLLKLGFSYATGAIVGTTLLLVTLASLLFYLKNAGDSTQTSIAFVVALTPLIGLLTMTVYYRRGAGTKLWLPRPVANYLLDRAKETRLSIEAGMLGAATVLGELPFLAGPLLIAGSVVVNQPPASWPVWALIYSLVASLPLIVMTLYLTSGHSIARVQKWREDNKTFLQWTSGVTLLVLTLYLTTIQLGVML